MTALFVERIAALGHEIAAIASPYSFGGSPIEWNGIPILGTARDIAGNDIILRNHEYFGADLTVILADPFGLLRSAKELSQVPTVTWFAVDADPVGFGDVTFLRESKTIPVAMSRFGQRMLANEGADPLLVPLAYDPGVYYPTEDRSVRDTWPGVTDETFVIGLCAMNRDPVRKAFQEQFLAFARFHMRHPDSFLAVHSTPGVKPGLNLSGLIADLGITEAVGFPDSYSYDLGLITEPQMAAWYNGLDVLTFCSYAEGFGLPLVESQACGVPVITTDASSMSELCGAGFLVSGTPWWSDGHTSWWRRPDVSDIENAYEAAFYARERGMLPRKPAVDFAAQFAVDRVTEDYWVPVLAQIEDMLG